MSRYDAGREITHRRDPDDGHMIQLVSAERLRDILDADGETYETPDGFGPDDEWVVAEPEGEDPEIARADHAYDEARDWELEDR